MAREFNGTTSKADFGRAVFSAYSAVNVPVSVAGSIQSHASPFRLQNGDILLAYSTNERGGNHEVFCKRSSDDGQTWGSAVVIEDDTGTTDAYECSFVQIANGKIFAFIGDGGDVVYRTSTDNGSTWSGQTQIDTGSTNDPHPSAVRIPSGTYADTIVVAYSLSGDIYCKRSTDDGATFSSRITILSDADDKRDPCIAHLPNGDLVCVWSRGATAVSEFYISRSTDGGQTWGAASVLYDIFSDTTSYYPDASILVCDGYTLVFMADGDNGNHRAFALVFDENLTRFKYRVFVDGTTTDDPHRVRGILNKNRIPLVFYTSYDGGADYAVVQVKQKAASQPVTDINNLRQFTAWAWIKYDGTPNAAGGHYVLSKNGIDKVQLYIQDDGGVNYNNQIRCYVSRSTSPVAYNSVDNVIQDNQWTFIAAVFDFNASPGNKMRMYTGTTPANLVEVGYSQQRDGSGTLNDDSAGNMVVGTRTIDNNRVFDGLIGAVGYTEEILDYDINVLRQLMVAEYPQEIGVFPAFFTKMEGFKTPVDFMTGRTATLTDVATANDIEPIHADPRTNFFWVPAVGGGQSVQLGLVSEAETAYAVLGAKTFNLAIAGETESAQPMQPDRALELGYVAESETAMPVGGAKARQLGALGEPEAAHPLTIDRGVVLGPVAEGETVYPLSHSKAVQLGIVIENETAHPITVGGGIEQRRGAGRFDDGAFSD